MNTNEPYSGKLTPEIIIKNDVRFLVPLYQRLFAWSKDEVSELLDDLKFHFEKWPDANPSDIHFPYYLGVVTTVPFKERHCLVDGQQRCTVLMIMASVFGRISTEWKAFFENGNRLELFAREDDAKFLKSLADGIPHGRYVNVLMAEAHRTIEKFFSRYGLEATEVIRRRLFFQNHDSKLGSASELSAGAVFSEPVFRDYELRRSEFGAARSIESFLT